MGERLAPVDEYGMPHAVILTEPFKPTADITPTEHHAFYRSKAKELRTEAGFALRISRVHMMPRWLHDIWHERYLNGLERLPQSEPEAFGLLVLSCAGYLSREGWQLQPDKKFELTEIDSPTYQRMRSRQEMHPQTESNSRIPQDAPFSRRVQDHAAQHISGFFTEYAKRQNLDHLKDTDFVDEFLTTADPHRKFELGRIILTEAMRVAVEPVSPIYQRALDQGLLRAQEADPLKVVTRLPFRGPWKRHVEVLERKLAA